MDTYDWVLNVKDNAESAGGSTPKAGDYFSYEITVTNEPTDSENRAAPVTQINLTVPTAIQLVEVSGLICGSTLPVDGPNVVSCTVPSLVAFESNSFTATMRANEAYSSSRIINFYSEIPTVNDPVVDNNSHSEPTTIAAGPGIVVPDEPDQTDLALSVSGPASAASTTEVSYTFTTTNRGPDAANKWELAVPIVNGLHFTSLPSGCGLVADRYSCTFYSNIVPSTESDPDPSKHTAVFTGIVTQADGPAGSEPSITISGTVEAPRDEDVVDGNNTASTTTAVSLGTDVSVSASANGTAVLGRTNELTITSAYKGDSPEGLEIRTVIPEGYGISGTGWTSPTGGWACSLSGREFACQRPHLGLSSSVTNIDLGSVVFDLEVLDDPSALTYRIQEDVDTSVTITSSGPADLDTTNNTASIRQDLQRPNVSLSIRKSASDNSGVLAANDHVVVSQPGNELDYTYSISVRNTGNIEFIENADYTVGEVFEDKIIVTDSLPAGVEYRGYTGSDWTCSPAASPSAPLNAPNLTCSIDYSGAPLPKGGSAPTLTLDVRFTQEGDITNTASAHAQTWPDGDDTDDVTVASYIVPNTADITVDTRVLVNPVATGDEQTVVLEVINNGSGTSKNILVTDTFTHLLNSGVGNSGDGLQSFVVTSGPHATGFDDADCSLTSTGTRSQRLTCTIESLAQCTAGADCPVITVKILPGDGPSASPNTLSNNVSAVGRDVPDTVPNNQDASVNYTTLERTDIEVGITASASSPIAGREYFYQVSVRNPTSSRYLNAADHSIVTQTLPAGVLFKRVSGATCSTAPAADELILAGSNDQLVCDLGTIPAGATETINVYFETIEKTSDFSLVTSALVTTSTLDLDSANDETSLTTTQKANPDFDLIVNSQDDVDPIDIGSTMHFDVTVRNAGPSFAENVTITYALPADHLTYQAVDPDGASCPTPPAIGSKGQNLICTFERINSGETKLLKITAEAVSKGQTSSTATLSSTAISNGVDRLAGNNTEDETTTVRTRVDGEVFSKTPSLAKVDLREPFDYTIIMKFASAAQFQEADDVVIKDTLPSNMYFVGGNAVTPIISVTSGTASNNSCVVASNARSFECSLGTVQKGSEIAITFPVYADNISSFPKTLTNTAKLETSSRDVDNNNNTKTGNVIVVGSSISGNVFMDFGDDGDNFDDPDPRNVNDKGAGGITITLSGTAFDGEAVSKTITTDANGDYTFSHLQRGTYAVSRQDVSGSKFLLDKLSFVGEVQENGTSTPVHTSIPADNGIASGVRELSVIKLAKDSKAVNYNFSVLPQARIGIALDEYSTSYPQIREDGSFVTRLVMRLENFSDEPIENVSISLPLNGVEPRFGNHTVLGAPLTDTLAAGSFTITAAPQDSLVSSSSASGCGGYNAAYNGQGDASVLSGIAIGAKARCDVEVQVRVQPIRPGPSSYPNPYQLQATVAAEGQFSDQIDTTYNLLTDLSDNGSNPDPDSDNNPTEDTEKDPTPVAPSYRSKLALIMSATPSWNTGTEVAKVGDTITYEYEIYSRKGSSSSSKGNISLQNIAIVDSKTGLILTGSPLAQKLPGDSAINSGYTGVYTLTQDDIEAGEVVHSSSVTATDVYGFTLDDVSGTAVSNNTPLTTPLTRRPEVALVAVPDAGLIKNPTEVGDKVLYTYNIKNTGNVILKNVRVTDTRSNVEGLSSVAILEIQPGAEVLSAFTASYPVTQSDLDALKIINTAQVEAEAVTAPSVTDVVGTAYTNDGPVETPLYIAPEIDLVLTADTSELTQSIAKAGEKLVYHYAVTNKGSVTLTNVTISNALTGVALTGGPITLAPLQTDTGSFRGEYLLTNADVAAQSVTNSATTTGSYGSPVLTVDDTDTKTTSIVFIEANSEVPWSFTTDGGTTSSVLASDLIGTDPATLTNANLSIVSKAAELTLDTSNATIKLASGSAAGTYQLTYRICRKDNPTVCAEATETVIQAPIDAIEATVTHELIDDGDGFDGLGDTVHYTVTIENKGNTEVRNLSFSDTFKTLENEDVLLLDSGPTFENASLGSAVGVLQRGEIATYKATYDLTVLAIDEGGVSYQVLATGLPVYPAGAGTPAHIDDLSDDGDDVDGNIVDDPTQLLLAPVVDESGLSLSKTTSSNVVMRGAVVPYTLKIINHLPVSAGPIDLVDILPADFVFVEGSAKLDGVKAFPDVEGRIVTFSGFKVSPKATVVATLSARVLVTADVGDHTNVGRLRNSQTGELLGRQAEATVSILPEHVFDCGDVYGKVFDDINRDGYQNPPQDDVIEYGIPAVKVTGVDGTVITTDEHGRFHVACAMLPKDRGSNFILKLDTRTLPAGYRVTTENPRVVRLTPGKMTELNFGATRAPVSKIGLNADGFINGKPSNLLKKALSGLAENLAYGPVHFELTYFLSEKKDSRETVEALAHLNRVEAYLSDLWTERGEETPTFEQSLSQKSN
ncbi:hypothetical protein PsAD13_01980 [Pseudovibrio sp. Ad13]|uniref:DUF7507 domain-containing protein n=1 Tax=Pseudovibrio sp. Ad13 TaxID=989396 RepID=UPI0007AE63DA|nr:SdrD B-like domain-containing protein [Pseudovibrio sp. Ad13]KZK84516.1 hypothetical protein PsAD13_01980 [Pseudovibrio sp. Ad13]